jgi:hypothetical protein
MHAFAPLRHHISSALALMDTDQNDGDLGDYGRRVGSKSGVLGIGSSLFSLIMGSSEAGSMGMRDLGDP